MTPRLRWPFSMECFYAMNEFTPLPLPSPPPFSPKVDSRMSNRRLTFRWPFSMKYFYAMNEFPPLSPASSSLPSEDEDSIRAAQWLASHDSGQFQMAPLDDSTFQPRLRDQIFKLEDFQSCLTNTSNTFVLQGMPGAGKTTTMQGLIARLTDDTETDRDESRLDSKIVTAALYLRPGRHLGFELEIQRILLHLLQVICKQVPNSMKAVKTLYQQAPAGRLPPASDIKTAIRHVLKRTKRTCIFIDVEDEYNYLASIFLSELKFVQKETKVGIILTVESGETERFLGETFKNLKFHQIFADPEDIAGYLRKRLEDKRDKDLVDSLASNISKAANGIFLVAQLYLLRLESFEKDDDRRQDVQELQHLQRQQGLELSRNWSRLEADTAIRLALNSVLERVFHTERTYEDKIIAASAMELVRHTTKRPLSIKQFLWSLNMDKATIPHPPQTLYDWAYVSSCCHGLVKDDGNGNAVFLHHTISQCHELSIYRGIQEFTRRLYRM